MAHITVQNVWKLENTLSISKLEYAKFWCYISKLLCTYRFYAKLIDINSSKDKTNNYNNGNNNDNKSAERNIYAMVE